MPALPRTENALRGLAPAPGEAQTIYRDDKLPGLLLVVGRAAKTWQLDYRADGRRRRHTLGRFPDVGRAAARKAAQAHRVAIDSGADPQAELVAYRAAQTVGDALDDYLRLHAAGKRTAAEYRRRIDVDVRPVIGHVKLPDLRAAHLVGVVDRIMARGAPVMANRVATLLRHFAGWLLDRELITTDPARRLRKRTKESSRTRVLSDAELATLWRALDSTSPQAALALRLLVLTGRRTSEVTGLPWAELDLDAGLWTLPGSRNKSGADWTFPLAAPVVALLQGRHAVTGHTGHVLRGMNYRGREPVPTGSIVRRAHYADLRNVLAAPWSPHDLRRTARTGMARLGVAPHVAELCLGHVPKGIGATYDVHRYRAEMAAAFELWAGHVMALTGGGPATVVPIRRAG